MNITKYVAKDLPLEMELLVINILFSLPVLAMQRNNS